MPPLTLDGTTGVSAVQTGAVESGDLAAGAIGSGDLPAGSVIQVVRSTDSTRRTTTSGSATDANISVTITPQKSTSEIIVIWSFQSLTGSAGRNLITQITDNSNNVLSGAEFGDVNNNGDSMNVPAQIIGYSTPATTSATTYKGRFFKDGAVGQVTLENDQNTGQLYAIEVSA